MNINEFNQNRRRRFKNESRPKRKLIPLREFVSCRMSSMNEFHLKFRITMNQYTFPYINVRTYSCTIILDHNLSRVLCS